MQTKELIKNYAYELGADLVGFGSIDRCAHAPLMMSPQGLFPGAQTVIVMGIHHPDACIELGGEKHPQEIGPYSVQYLMNSRLDEMSYRLATFLERNGHGALPIASSNIWRYNQYKELKAIFAPDISNIYMPVVAGLADMGFNGLALTPEYGARNRFITVVTDAVLAPDPLIPPGTICDHCMLCRKNCPSKALSTEINGDKVLKIADYEYRFPNKNLWRCAWGEHFDLDLDLHIPEVVTEQTILDNVKTHGIRSGEMGQCLKFCVPKPIRSFDRTYSRTPMRQYWVTTDETREPRAAMDRMLARAFTRGTDELYVNSAAELKQAGIDLETILPGAKSAVTVLTEIPKMSDSAEFRFGAQYQMDSLCYDMTRNLEEFGFRSVMAIESSGSHPDAVKDTDWSRRLINATGIGKGRQLAANTVITRKTIAPQRRSVTDGPAPIDLDHGNAVADLNTHILRLATELGADLAGIASAERITELVGQLRPVFAGESLLAAKDQAVRFSPWLPEVTVQPRRITTAGDHLPGATSVLVFGLRLHEQVLHNATKPPAEAVGPYSFQTYITSWLGSIIGFRLVKHLQALGYQATMTMDLTGTDSVTATPRGPQPDLFSNRFAGLAAGLGQLTLSGHLATPQFGIRQRLISIVTNAPLTASPLRPSGQAEACATCDQSCVRDCPSQAITGETVQVACEDRTYRFNRIDGKRCDWVKRYALMGDSGFKYLGSKTDVAAPQHPTTDDLTAALKQHDPIKKYRPVVAEPCVLSCPLAGKIGTR